MQVNEAFAVRKIEGSIRASVGIMKDVNTLIRLPELGATMRDLSVELMKAGIIEEMVEDTLPEDGDMLLEDEAEEEVDKILGEVLKQKETKLPAAPVPEPVKQVAQPQQQQVEDEEEEDADALMDQMRDRLEALRS
jgi:charged multivesicular body protein 3